MSSTARNKGTLAGGRGAAGLVVVWEELSTGTIKGGVAEKRAGGSGNEVENIPPHSHKPFKRHWPITHKKKGCSGLEHPSYGGAEKQGVLFSLSGSKIL